MAKPKLTPLKAFNLLVDIEQNKIKPDKALAAKYGIGRGMVGWYRKKYFYIQLIRKPVEWPYIGKVPYYLRKKITRQ